MKIKIAFFLLLFATDSALSMADPHGPTQLQQPIYIEAIKAERPKDDHIINAIQRDDLVAVIDFINKKIDLNAKYVAPCSDEYNFDLHENTALMYAARYGRLLIAEKLLEAGADPNIKNKQGHTALTLCNEHTPVLHALLKGKAKPNIQVFQGNTALIYSVMRQDKDQTYLLLCYGADPSVRNKLELSAKDYAQTAGAHFIQLLALFTTYTMPNNHPGQIVSDNQVMGDIQQES